MQTVKLLLDIANGTLELECASDDFEKIMGRIESTMRNFPAAHHKPRMIEPDAAEEVNGDDKPVIESSSNAPKIAGKPRKKKGGGHTVNWKVVDNLLSDKQRLDLKDFYSEKSPSNQNDQVAVLSFKLTEMLGREGFDGHEIHTAFQVVGVKTPANLSGVFGNMATIDLGKMIDKKWTPNFKSSDRVKHDLPAALKK